MRPKQPERQETDDLFRSRLDQIIDMGHELVRLAETIDWVWLDAQLAERFADKGRLGDQINAMLTAVGYNFRRILTWINDLLAQILAVILSAPRPISILKTAS